MTALLLMALLLSPPADQVRDTETAFADRDAAKFFAFRQRRRHVPRRQTNDERQERGDEGVVGVFQEAKAPFSWKPERVFTNAAGDLGLSTGPVFDAEGKHVSDYSLIWQKQKDGTWKIAFDGPGARVSVKFLRAARVVWVPWRVIFSAPQSD